MRGRATAKHGSITRACEELHLTPQTVSAQIRTLEGVIGEELFRRTGRRMELTETGGRLAHNNSGMRISKALWNEDGSRLFLAGGHGQPSKRKDLEDLEGTSEDDVRGAETQLDSLKDEFIGMIDAAQAQKEEELLEV